MSAEQAGCHECRIARGEESALSLRPVRRGAFVIHADAGDVPVPGRFVVAPVRHVPSLDALAAGELSALGPLLAELAAALRAETGGAEPDIDIVSSAAHLHAEVVPGRTVEEDATELARRVLGRLAREGRPSWRPALLSGLVWPGLGQITKRQYLKGLLLMALSLLVAIAVALRIARDVLESLWSNPSELDLVQLVVAAQRVREASGGFVLLGSLALAALWIYAVADAYRSPPRS
jgi:diadenosine tetraphosphate (Ap4A) HIT family hydrolase